MAKVKSIQLYEVEIVSEMALAMAYCIGATYDNAEEIANSFDPEEIYDCIALIRERLSKGGETDGKVYQMQFL